MLMLLLIKKRKRHCSYDKDLQVFKCLHKYDTSNKQYFTHPETGIRSIMTFKYTNWFQKNIMYPLLQLDKFLRVF